MVLAQLVVSINENRLVPPAQVLGQAQSFVQHAAVVLVISEGRKERTSSPETTPGRRYFWSSPVKGGRAVFKSFGWRQGARGGRGGGAHSRCLNGAACSR